MTEIEVADGVAGAGETDQGDRPVVAEGRRRDAAGRFLPQRAAGAKAPRATARRRAAPGGKRARPRKPVAWSATRERRFLETLAETSCIAASIRASGLSETSVYRRRRTSAAFRASWAEALREGYARLQGMLLDRALNGIEKTVYHGGQKIGTKREFNDATALALLRLHRETVMGTAPIAEEEPIEQVRARLKAKLREMNKRMGGAG